MTAHLRQLVLRKVLPGALALLCLLPCYVGAYFWWKKAKLVNNWMERLADKPRIRIVVNNSHTLYSSEADEITWEQKRVDILERHYTSDAVTLIGYIDEEETGWWSDVYQGWKKISKEKIASFVQEELVSFDGEKLSMTGKGMDVYNSIVTSLLMKI